MSKPLTKPQNSGLYARGCRLNAKLSQTEVAVRLGVRPQAISAFEQNVVGIPAKRLYALHKIINLDLKIMVGLMTREYKLKLINAINKNLKEKK